MGLDCSHEAWHGAYSAFMRWREKIAEVAGLPPLRMMAGFWEKGLAPYDPATLVPEGHYSKEAVNRFCEGLPISWDCLKPRPLYILLSHSDCDGEIAAEDCGPLADDLATIVQLMPEGEAGGHIGNWKEKTQQFVDGLREAAKANEPLLFR